MEWWVIPAGFAAFWTLFVGITAWLGSDSVPNLRLQRKHVIVTGGSEGLGLELCKLLAKKGAHVSIIARDLKKLEIAEKSVRAECKDETQKVQTFSADTTDPAALQAVIDKAIKAHDGVVDVLVANAGFAHPAIFEDLDYQKHWERLMKVNYFGTLNAVKAVLPTMRARKSGRIVCVNSVLGFMSVYGYSAYSASKYAMRALVETLHQENYPYGISCSLIASGSIGSKTFFEEEQRVKPEITKLIEADDYVSKPEETAAQVVSNIEKWRMIAPVGGWMPWIMMIITHGMAVGSFAELFTAGLLNPILTPISWPLFNKNCRDIILKNHKPKKN